MHRKERMESIRERLINQRRKEFEILCITGKISKWMKKCKIETRKLKIYINVLDLNKLFYYFIQNKNIIVCHSHDIKFSNKKLKCCVNSWFVTYQEQENVMQIYLVQKN